jgi:hypothetical protein
VVADDVMTAGKIDDRVFSKELLLVTVPEEVAAIEDAIVKDAAITDATSLVFFLLYGVCHLSNEALLYLYCVFHNHS